MAAMKQELMKVRLDRRRSMRDQIYDVLRKLILSGKIGPGEAIDDKAIASLLKVSRTPVREAVKKLSDEHLVDVVAQSGTRAALIDRHEVEQAYIIRKALEMESAAQAALLMTQADGERLSDTVQQHARALARQDYDEAISIDDMFHRTISDISNLPRLWHTVEISKAQLDRCRRMMVPLVGEGEITLEHHRQIVSALMSKDPDQARIAMGAHLDVAYENAIKVLASDVKENSAA